MKTAVARGSGSEKAAAVRELLGQGLTERETAERLGVSQQRVNQLKGKEAPDESQRGLQMRLLKAKAEREEANAEQARLRADEMRGKLIPLAAVEELVRQLRGRLDVSSKSLRKLKEGKAAVDILRQAMEGVDADLKAMLERG